MAFDTIRLTTANVPIRIDREKERVRDGEREGKERKDGERGQRVREGKRGRVKDGEGERVMGRSCQVIIHCVN